MKSPSTDYQALIVADWKCAGSNAEKCGIYAKNKTLLMAKMGKLVGTGIEQEYPALSA